MTSPELDDEARLRALGYTHRPRVTVDAGEPVGSLD